MTELAQINELASSEVEHVTWWKATWPFDRTHWKQLFTTLVGFVAVASLIGFAFTDWFTPNAITAFDEDVAERLVDSRTSGLDDLSHWGAFLADTPVKIGGSIVLAAALLYRWRRWHEAAFIGLTLIFEATVFIITTFIVSRPRPDVPRLLDSPVDTSYPSGHVAAATVYTAIAVVVFWHTRSLWARSLAVIVTATIPVIVAWARMYQGMHYFSDVVAGAILGALSVWVCLRILGRPTRTTDATTRTHEAVL